MLNYKGEVKNDVIVMEPLISTVTVLFQVENSNNSYAHICIKYVQ